MTKEEKEKKIEEEMVETDESFLEEEDADFFNEDRDSFLQPSTKTRFTLRKRKRRVIGDKGQDKTDGDSVSLCSLDMEQDQPETKKKKHLSKMSSLSNMLSLSKVSKMGTALQKSMSSSRFGSPMGSKRHPAVPASRGQPPQSLVTLSMSMGAENLLVQCRCNRILKDLLVGQVLHSGSLQ